MKKTKQLVALLVSLLLVCSFSLFALAEDTGTPSLGEAGGAFGQGLTDLIGNMGGAVDFDFSSLFGGIGALGDIDIGGYLSNINMGSLSEELSGFAENFFQSGEGGGVGGLDGIGSIVNDIGMGDFGTMLQEGLDSLIGIGSEVGGGTGESGGGFTDVISGFAGSIADMTGNFDITEVLGGLIGGSGSGSSSGTGTGTGTQAPTVTVPSVDTSPGVIIGGGSNNTNTGDTVTVPTTVQEVTTQEYTTRRLIGQVQATDNTGEIPEEPAPKNTNKIVAGVILVLGSFGAVAYIVVKKVI